jgi:transposase
VALELFGKLHQPSTIAFLRAYPTPQVAMSASVEQLTILLKQMRHPQAKLAAQQITERLKQPHLLANAVTTRTKSRLMLALVAQLEPLIEQIAAYDKEIARLFLKHEDHELFQTLPGAGQRLAPRLLAEIGDDRTRYDDAGSLQALAGTSPVLFQSGAYLKAHRRLGCIKPLRNALQQFARPRTHLEPWARDYYQHKRAAGKSHTVAIRALANVWVRILFAMWFKREEYQRAIFEHAQHQHAPRAA